jgi:hypothetical protein
MCWAKFWAIFSQTRLVTLPTTSVLCAYNKTQHPAEVNFMISEKVTNPCIAIICLRLMHLDKNKFVTLILFAKK